MKAKFMAIVGLFIILTLSGLTVPVSAWGNGGFTSYEQATSNPQTVDVGTHDYIAGEAFDNTLKSKYSWLVDDEDNIWHYLYGTELPDNKAPSTYSFNWQGDTFNHHVYYDRNTNNLTDCIDDIGALRVQQSYEMAIKYYKEGKYYLAALYLGAATHYMADLAVFGHVMSDKTPWGAEDPQHHEDFETLTDNDIKTVLTYDDIKYYLTHEKNYTLAFMGFDDTLDILNTIHENQYVIEVLIGQIKQSLQSVSEEGYIAPYYIALQVARINTFGLTSYTQNYTPSDNRTPQSVFTDDTVVSYRGILHDAELAPAPYIEYHYSQFTTEDKVKIIAGSLLLAIAGVRLMLEQFPEKPSYTTISGEEETEQSVDTSTIMDVLSHTCCLTSNVVIFTVIFFAIFTPLNVRRKGDKYANQQRQDNDMSNHR